MKKLKISAIKDGTVIDHLPAENTFRVVKILNLDTTPNTISVASNLDSHKLGKKGIVKISGKVLSEKEVNKISLIAPSATVNIIKNYEVKKKSNVKVPRSFEGIINCINTNCITHSEELKGRFSVVSSVPLKLRCRYCETTFGSKELIHR